jgi:phosphotransferase system HPr-like phosphotransfer protein
MKLKAAHGKPLQIRADGEDAAAAVTALCALIDRNFDG